MKKTKNLLILFAVWVVIYSYLIIRYFGWFPLSLSFNICSLLFIGAFLFVRRYGFGYEYGIVKSGVGGMDLIIEDSKKISFIGNAHVFKNTLYMSLNGALFAAVKTYPFPTEDEPNRFLYWVFVDRNWDKLSDNAKLFVYHHEIAHTTQVRSPTTALERHQKLMNGEVCEYELDADFKSAQVVGKENAIEALKELQSVTRNKVAKTELGQRVDWLSERIM